MRRFPVSRRRPRPTATPATRAGADVVQLYVGQPAGNGEPPKQRKGFKKVQLDPGQSRQVSFPLTPRDLAHWTGSWTTNAGQYRVYVGDSSRTAALNVS